MSGAGRRVILGHGYSIGTHTETDALSALEPCPNCSTSRTTHFQSRYETKDGPVGLEGRGAKGAARSTLGCEKEAARGLSPIAVNVCVCVCGGVCLCVCILG